MVPNIITYGAMMSACEKGSQPKGALEVFQSMQRPNVVPGMISYSAFISTCEKDT